MRAGPVRTHCTDEEAFARADNSFGSGMSVPTRIIHCLTRKDNNATQKLLNFTEVTV